MLYPVSYTKKIQQKINVNLPAYVLSFAQCLS